MKGFSSFSVISWAFSISSNMPAAMSPLTIIFLSAFKWWYNCTVHLACKDFITKSRGETFTSGGAMPFLSSFEIQFAIQVSYFSKTFAFAALVTLRYSGLSKVVRYDHNLGVIFGAKFSQVIVVVPLKRIHYHQHYLLFCAHHILFDLI